MMTISMLRCGMTFWLLATSVQSQGAEALDHSGSPAHESVLEFIHTVHLHGVPFDQARRFDVSAMPTLLAVLGDRREEAYWINAVATLGAIGDEQALDPLIEFLTEPVPGILSESHYRAKAGVLIALGYLINASGSQKALDFLTGATTLEFWSNENPRWISPYHTSDEERNIQLVKKAILGLGISGHSDARDVLMSLQSPTLDAPTRRLRERVKEEVVEALRSHRIVSEVGLSGYYRR